MIKGLFLFIFLKFAMVIGQTKSDDILGVWLTQLKDANIEIYKKENKYYGRVIWLKESLDENGEPIRDKYNPSNELKDRRIISIDILIGFKFENDKWVNGYIYDPKNGELYSCKLWINNGNLIVRGYSGWLFDTKIWTKVS